MYKVSDFVYITVGAPWLTLIQPVVCGLPVGKQ
jgi:hypothetical protein